MKATCHREGLLAACQLASAAVAARDVKPIYKNFKAVADDGRCTLMATDLELGIRLEVRGLNVDEPGDAILPAAKLLSILRESTVEELVIEADPSSCRVTSDNGDWEMPGEDPTHFADLPSFAEEKYHEIQAKPLREMIRRTVFAAATDIGKYSMTGVLWEADGDKVRLVATDGKRMALTEGPATAHGGHSTRNATPIVPTKAMNLLDRNLQDNDEMIRVALRPNEVLFKTERAVVVSRLVEGRFPSWRDVFAKKPPLKVPLMVGPLQTAVRQAQIMTEEDTRKVAFKFAKNKLTLEAQGQTTGRSKVALAVAYEGKPLEISFNAGYVLDMLKVLPEETPLSLELIDGNNPAFFRAGEDYTYLIMPLS